MKERENTQHTKGDEVKTYLLYAHPIILFILILVAFIFAMIPNFEVLAIILCIVDLVYYIFLGGNKQTLQILNIWGIYSKKKCIEQKYFLKFESNDCPRKCFKKELKELIEEIPPKTKYVTATHQKVIDILKKQDDVIEGKVEVIQHPFYMKSNIKKAERSLYNKKKCDSCKKEICRIYKAAHSKEKDIREVYAVEIYRK